MARPISTDNSSSADNLRNKQGRGSPGPWTQGNDRDGWGAGLPTRCQGPQPMSKGKPTPGGPGKKRTEVSLVRSFAAEYLTFVAASGQGCVQAVYEDGNLWLSQKMTGLLYDVETQKAAQNIQNPVA